MAKIKKLNLFLNNAWTEYDLAADVTASDVSLSTNVAGQSNVQDALSEVLGTDALTGSKALTTNADGQITASNVTSTELGRLGGVTTDLKNAIVSITRSGTTFTATKADGTTTTFTQQDNNTDTKNTAGSTDTNSKIFLIGATSQAANPQTYSHDTCYVGTNGRLYTGGYLVPYIDQRTSDASYLTDAKFGSYYGPTSDPTQTQIGQITFTHSDTTKTRSIIFKDSGISMYNANSTTVGRWSISDDYITNITRSGTTFTATRKDGTTFTFTQQDNDTKNTAGSTNTSSKIYLIGATSQAANPQTYSQDTAYVGTDGYVYSNGMKTVVVAPNSNSTTSDLRTISFSSLMNSSNSQIFRISAVHSNTSYDRTLIIADSGMSLWNGNTSTTEWNIKTRQSAKSDPTASGTSNTFIATISQDANGEITATKKTVAVTNSAPTLSWGATSTIGSVAGTNLTVKMPANPNTNTTYTTLSQHYQNTASVTVGANAQSDPITLTCSSPASTAYPYTGIGEINLGNGSLLIATIAGVANAKAGTMSITVRNVTSSSVTVAATKMHINMQFLKAN